VARPEQERVAGGGAERQAVADRSWSPGLTIVFGVALIACAAVLFVVTDDPTDLNSRLPLPIWLVDLVVALVGLSFVTMGIRGRRRRVSARARRSG
jgi:hypothetical protein